MQIVVLGMHRSGTSMLAGLLDQMGVYFGDAKDSIGANEQNPLGFWERIDVRNINDALLFAQNSDWNKISNFDVLKVSEIDQEKFSLASHLLINKLDSHGSWLIKEPRLCLLISLWMRTLDDPVFVHIYRNPLEVAWSLNTRNQISIMEGISLWERYVVEAVNQTRSAKNILVSHAKIMDDPVGQTDILFNALTSYGVKGIRELDAKGVRNFIRKDLHRERHKGDVEDFLNINQLKLFRSLESGTAIQGHQQLKCSAGGRSTLVNYDLVSERMARLTERTARLSEQGRSALTISTELLISIDRIYLSQRWRIGSLISKLVRCLMLKNANVPSSYKEVKALRSKLTILKSGNEFDVSD